MIPREIFAETLRGLLEPVGAYLDDASVSEIMINGPSQIYVERKGRLELTDARFSSTGTLLAALRNVAQYAGTFFDAQHPILEARLPDGSRIEAVLSPIAQDGPAVAIRRFSKSTLTLGKLIEFGALTPDAAEALRVMMVAKCNMAVAGGTGTGKTSMLNVLAACIPEGERVLVLEDTRELEVERKHVVYLEARKPDQEGNGAVSIRDLFRASLRMRPDRIIVGEIRGAEALDMIQAMVSGHGGCLSTLHASYPRDTLSRLETMCMMSDVEMPLAAIRVQVGSGVEAIVQISRLADGRRVVTHITEVVGFDLERGKYELQDLFLRDSQTGELTPTGVLPTFLPRLHEHGVELPDAMLRAHRQRGGRS